MKTTDLNNYNLKTVQKLSAHFVKEIVNIYMQTLFLFNTTT